MGKGETLRRLERGVGKAQTDLERREHALTVRERSFRIEQMAVEKARRQILWAFGAMVVLVGSGIWICWRLAG